MRNRKSWFRLLVITGCSFASGLGAELRVVGSDLLGLEFSRAFYAYSGSNGLELALAFDGSRAGFERVKAGRADLGLMVLPPGAETAPLGLRAAVVGYHRVVVLVPAACPLERITLPQLAAIFGAPSANAGANATRWSDLGATGDGSGAALVPVAPVAGAGLTAEYFRSAVLRGGDWKSSVQRYASSAELAAHFAGEAKPIVLAAALPAGNAAIKVLPVAAGVRQPGVAASQETLAAETYPLRAPVHVVFSSERRAAVEPLLRFLFSDAAARALEQADIVPLPAAVRSERLGSLLVPHKPAK